jgi:hypothetical protein
MKDRFKLCGIVLAVSLGVAACGKSTSSPTAANPNATKPATTTANQTKKSEPAKPTTEIKNAKKPEGASAKAVPAAKKVPVPDNWLYMYDDVKGYGFYVPEGSKGNSDTVEGINVYTATTPAPADVAVVVLAYKDKTLTKEDLLADALKFIEGMGEKVQAGTLTAESDDYALADATSVDSDGKKSKLRILVGTDVTDNYVMIVGTDENKFDANKEIIDAIWGSFEMWSL